MRVLRWLRGLDFFERILGGVVGTLILIALVALEIQPK